MRAVPAPGRWPARQATSADGADGNRSASASRASGHHGAVGPRVGEQEDRPGATSRGALPCDPAQDRLDVAESGLGLDDDHQARGSYGGRSGPRLAGHRIGDPDLKAPCPLAAEPMLAKRPSRQAAACPLRTRVPGYSLRRWLEPNGRARWPRRSSSRRSIGRPSSIRESLTVRYPPPARARSAWRPCRVSSARVRAGDVHGPRSVACSHGPSRTRPELRDPDCSFAC